jgi:hypothetical protein
MSGGGKVGTCFSRSVLSLQEDTESLKKVTYGVGLLSSCLVDRATAPAIRVIWTTALSCPPIVSTGRGMKEIPSLSHAYTVFQHCCRKRAGGCELGELSNYSYQLTFFTSLLK